VAAEDVVVEDLAELFVRDAVHRPVVGIAGRVAHEDADVAERLVRAPHEVLQGRLRGDACGNGERPTRAEAFVQACGYLVAGVLATRRDHHSRTVLG
jgi:hypothetical protein